MQDEVDRQLLEQARAGDASALERLLERHQAEVYRFGLRMCRDPEDARDVLQETLLAMARGVRGADASPFRGASSLSTWLFTIARSHCIKKRRRRKDAPEHVRSLDDAPEAAAVADAGRGPDEALDARRVELALERAIEALPAPYREVLLLRDVEGLTAPEVAEVLGLGIPAIKSRLHRARLAVRAQVAPSLGLAPDEAPPGASCPDVLTLMSRHLEGEIDEPACRAMEQHLEGCEKCRGACASLKRTLALCRSDRASGEVPRDVRAQVQDALRAALAEAR